MKRITIAPRPDWEKTVEEIGLIYHHTEGQPYWNESAYYSFRSAEIDRMELATNELHDMCLKAAQHIIERNRFAELGIPVPAISVIKQAWEDEPPALLRPLRSRFRRQGLKASRVQRRHSDCTARSRGCPVVLAPGCVSKTRSVQLDS